MRRGVLRIWVAYLVEVVDRRGLIQKVRMNCRWRVRPERGLDTAVLPETQGPLTEIIYGPRGGSAEGELAA